MGTADSCRRCRFCGSLLHHTFIDLGASPLCESFLTAEQLDDMEPHYPLRAEVCGACFLVQVKEYVPPERIFSEYAYFSSYSESWLTHAKVYAHAMADRFALGRNSLVVEVGSNDGYLLQYFVELQIPVLGVEPAANVARAAVGRGVSTLVAMFDETTARQLVASGQGADLLVGNNVLAQVSDLNGFVAGLKVLLRPKGVITLEFPHLLRLMEENQFDTVYHEHFSYFSLTTVRKILGAHELTLFDVEELQTHGGSLRIYARHSSDASRPIQPRVTELTVREDVAGLTRLAAYKSFDEQVKATKRKLLDFLIGVKRDGKSVAGYGAPGKGNTLLNYCGIRTDFLEYTVDRNPYKHGRFTPGTRIPIYAPSKIMETKPDYVLILPWNVKDEIMEQMAGIRGWGGRFVVPIPEVKVYP